MSQLPACDIHIALPGGYHGTVSVAGDWTRYAWLRAVAGVVGLVALGGMAIASGLGAPAGVTMVVAGLGLAAGVGSATAAAAEPGFNTDVAPCGTKRHLEAM